MPIFMSATLGDLHPILVHFPIVLILLGLFCDLLNGIGKQGTLPVAHWMFIGGALMCLPTLITGWEASKQFPNNPLVPIHMLLAFSTSSAALLYGAFRLCALYKQWEIQPLYYIFLSVLLAILVSWTADYGGRISHGISIFSLFL